MEDITSNEHNNNNMNPMSLSSELAAHGRHWLINDPGTLALDANQLEYELSDSDNDDYDDDESYASSDAQEEWEESLKQLDHMIMYILVPLVGKFFGRKFSQYAWGSFLAYLYPSVGVPVASATSYGRSLLNLFGLAK